MSDTPLLVTPDWLADQGRDPAIKVIDASFHLPTSGRDVQAEFTAKHIPGAVLFDINQVKDQTSPLPHMLPSATEFGQMVGALGIGNGDHVITYDSVGIFSAPRAWWMFRAMGHDQVSVLDGGLPAWKRAGHSTAQGATPSPTPTTFNVQRQDAMILDLAAMAAQVKNGAPVLDARAADRFAGAKPEPRAGLRSGHIPGSTNLPFHQLLDSSHGGFLGTAQLRAIFEQAGVDFDQPLITSCGSGVTAAVLTFALALLGKHDVQLYDGSWAEWGLEGGPAIATGCP
ncbi:MAG: 3-mercaptopyruvate sulfurtransferase [Pseudomonadota bacterium]